MSTLGKWKTGSLQLLWNNSSVVFSTPLTIMRFYTNDWVPYSGWVDADVTILAATSAFATRPGVWEASVIVSPGIIYRTTAAAWSFGIDPLLGATTVYGFVIGQGTNTTPLYAERFRDGPYVIDGSTVISVKPFLYLRNSDVELP